jgi:hypothetical protein
MNRDRRQLVGVPFRIGAIALLLAWALLLSGGHIWAQMSTATLTGVVHDPSGAVLPNATVTLRNVDTSIEHTSIANNTGAYAFHDILPGKYTVAAQAEGFVPQKYSEFVLAVSQSANLDFELKVGSDTTVVNVDASAAQLEVSSSELGLVMATKAVNDLPLNGRNFTQLLSLTPGVVPVSTGQNSMGGRNGGFAAPVAEGSSFTFPAINGQSNRSNFFLSDGLNNYGSFLSTYAVPPIIDAIQEFKTVSHTDSAEYGSVLGGVVNVVTKSGSNNLHGSAWEYVRNNIFDARNYFLPLSQPKPAYHQNQFGASGGGPVIIPKLYNGRNKTFFFGAYQGFRYSQPANTSLKVPTAAQLAGDLSSSHQLYNPFSTRINPDQPDPNKPGHYLRDPFPGNQIPTNLISPQMVAYANFIFPKAGPAFDSNGDNAIDTTPLVQNQNEWTVRGDQTFGEKNSAWFRYSSINSRVTRSGGLPGLPTIESIPARNWGGSYVHVFSQSLLMQAQFARTTVQDLNSTRWTANTSNIYNQVGFATEFAGNFTATNVPQLIPSPGIGGYTSAGEIIQNTPKATDSWQFAGTVTKTFGRHQMVFGGGYTTNSFAQPNSYVNLGYAPLQTSNTNPGANDPISGDALASFLLNVPDNANRRNVGETTRPGGVFSTFAQETWKATPKLTINAGLRYDISFIPPYGTNATIGKNGGIETGEIDFNTGLYLVQKLPPSCIERGYAPCIPGDGTLPEHVVVDTRGKIAYNTYDNIGPRAGVAYKVNDKLVVRGGYGIMYDNWAAVSQMAQNIEGSWPDIGQLINQNINNPTTASATPTITSQDPFAGGGSGLFPAPTPFNQVQWFYDPHIKNAYSEQWNVGLQQQITPSTTATMTYVGSVTHRVNVGGMYNTALTPGPGDVGPRSPYPYITPTFYDRSNGNANYNALQAQLDKRYTNGLAYNVAYTWSKSINEGGDGWFGAEGGVPVDPYHPAAYGSRSVSGTDLTNVFTATVLWQLPFGKGQKWSTGNNVVDYIVGNWQFNNIFAARSGLPYTPIISSDIANTGNVGWAGYEHANLVGNPNTIAKRTPAKWFNTAAYASPAQYTYGTSGRNSLRGPAYWDLTSSVFRQFPVWGERRFEFRAEAFNLFNHAIFGQPNSDLNNGSSFGTINNTANQPREIQLGAKFIF